MPTGSLAHERVRWKRWGTGLVAAALGITVIAITAAYWRSQARREKALPVPRALPTNVNQQLSGYSFTRSVEGRQIFTVHAARTVAFKEGGTTVLEDVRVEVFGREGNRRDMLRTHVCEANVRSGSLFCSGRVEIELGAGTGPAVAAGSPVPSVRRGSFPVTLETSGLAFRQEGSLVVTDQPVRFEIGPAWGSAQGMTYATRDGWMELKKEVVVELQPKRQETSKMGQLPIRLTAGRLRYYPPGGTASPEPAELKLTGAIEIVQGTRRVLADEGKVLMDDRRRITQAWLEGNVRAFDSAGGDPLTARADQLHAEFDPLTGQLKAIVAEGGVAGESSRGAKGATRRLAADRFGIEFQGPHPSPRAGRAIGHVELTLVSSKLEPGASAVRAQGENPPKETETLSAPQADFMFRSAWRLNELDTVGAGKIMVRPFEPRSGERVITAAQFLLSFDGRGRLEVLRGLGQTQIVFQPARDAPPGTAPKTGSADQLEASFDPASQSLTQVEQAGNFKFMDGDRQAVAERARYQPLSQLFVLMGKPRTWDATTRMSAERIQIDLGADTLEGAAHVTSTHWGATGPAGKDHSADPTNVLADRMTADRRSQAVHYEGHVRAWHGADVLESRSLDVDRPGRRLSSGIEVLTSHLQPAARAGGTGAGNSPAPRDRPLTIRAEQLEYFDEGRTASYRGHVVLQTENTTLTADHVEVYFSASSSLDQSEIDRAVADGHVTVAQPARRASGERADYTARDGRILLSGGSPTLYDAEKGETTGRRLTFFTRDDRLIVDGGENSPAVSKHRIAQ